MGKTYKDREDEEQVSIDHFIRKDRKWQKPQELIKKIDKEVPIKEKY